MFFFCKQSYLKNIKKVRFYFFYLVVFPIVGNILFQKRGNFFFKVGNFCGKILIFLEVLNNKKEKLIIELISLFLFILKIYFT